MNNDHFSRLLRLAQRTGDRLIVTGAEGTEPVVILPLDEYESLIDNALNLSERGLEVAEEWTPTSEFEDEADFDQDDLEHGALKKLWQEPQTEGSPLEIIERQEPELPQLQQAREQIISTEIPVEQPVRDPQKMAKIRPLSRVPGMGRPQSEGGEEQFYLEPI